MLYIWVGEKKVMLMSISNVLLLKDSLRTFRAQAPAAAAPGRGRQVHSEGLQDDQVETRAGGGGKKQYFYRFLSEMCTAASSTI